MDDATRDASAATRDASDTTRDARRRLTARTLIVTLMNGPTTSNSTKYPRKHLSQLHPPPVSFEVRSHRNKPPREFAKGEHQKRGSYDFHRARKIQRRSDQRAPRFIRGLKVQTTRAERVVQT